MKQCRYSQIDQLYNQLVSDGLFIFEEDTPYFQEKLLQIIWNEQLFIPTLSTEAGQSVEIIHGGVWNLESGPDFRDATLSIDGKTVRGDIEIHFRPGDWNKHNHQTNPDYERVVLHVVWHNPRELHELPMGVPLLHIQRHLSIPIQDVISTFDVLSYPYAKQVPPGDYAGFISALDDREIIDLLQSFGIARILEKAQYLAASMAKVGLETATYRAFFDGLGYKGNRTAFGKLADAITLGDLAASEPNAALAILFGTAGLLPDPTQVDVFPDYRQWVDEMWAEWWSKRSRYDVIEWDRSRHRPQNAPERRIMAGHQVLLRNKYALGARIIDAFTSPNEPAAAIRKMRQLFTVTDDETLSRFLSFSRQLKKPISLLGPGRTDDLVVNVGITIFIAHSFIIGEPQKCKLAKAVLLGMPKLQDNRRLKEAAHHFFVPPSRARDVVVTAAAQQGLMKLYDDARQY